MTYLYMGAGIFFSFWLKHLLKKWMRRTLKRTWGTFPSPLEWVSVKSSFSPSHQERLQILCVFLFWVEIGVYFISVDGDWYLSTCHTDHWLSIKITCLCRIRFRPSSPCPSLSWNGTWGCSQCPNILPHADIPAYLSCPWPINLGMETHKGR